MINDGFIISEYSTEYCDGVRCVLKHSDKRILQTSMDALKPMDNSEIKEGVRAYVAINKEGKVVGYSASDNNCSITVVKPSHRGMGIGTELLRIKLLNVTHTTVGATNVASINMVIKCGFVCIKAGVHENEKPWLLFKRGEL